MSKFSVFVLGMFTVLSCSNPDDFGLESTEFVYAEQRWELVRMTGSFVGSETTGDAMEWQEYYLFTPDGTFIKSRTRVEEVTQATGVFEVLEFEGDDEHYLELTYETGTELIGSCTAEIKEILIYRSSNRISNTWLACDGPGLDYMLKSN